MTRLRSAILFCAILPISGCGAGWHRQPTEPVGAIDPRQHVQLWSGGRVVRWHGVRLAPDSVSGLPYVAPLTCDSCRVGLPLTSVDSLRYGNPSAGFWKTFGVIMGGAVLLAIVLCCPAST